MKIIFLLTPRKRKPSGVQGVIRQDEFFPLCVGQPAFDEGEIQIHVAAINLVADDRMTEVREVDADLMFAAGVRTNTEQRKSGKR